MSGETDLISIIGTDNQNRKADIIFVHGLGGDARGTWHPQGKKDDNNFWPMWLGEDFDDCGIWSINYQVEPTKWRGSTMFLSDRATNTVDLLAVHKLGTRPIIFITHSMGGLVIKQMLCNATYSKESSWKRIVEQTQGIVFLSTPHSGSNIANWFKYIGGILGATVSIKELEADNHDLVNLNTQYCNHERLSKIPVLVYYEGQKTKLTFFAEAIVVDRESANPGSNINKRKIVQLDEDHISISKPNSKGHHLYLAVKEFIKNCLFNSNQNISYEDENFRTNDKKVETTKSESNQGNYNKNIHGDSIQQNESQILPRQKPLIKEEIEDLQEERNACYSQYRSVIDEGQRVRLKRKLKVLDQQIEKLLDNLNGI